MYTPLSIISSLQWQDIVDIVFNSYILFRLYILFRKTAVLRVLIGIALLWLLQRIAVSMGMILTSWALQGITAATALLIIIVFRNEIRAVLQAKNLKTILWDISPPMRTAPVDIIVESVYELSRLQRGALIIIPGMDDLEETVMNGIPWQGIISKEMLLSIFWPENPVHDGAAIVGGQRIERVAGILPLSKRQDLPSYFGTRHRAALGLSEVTDALIITVSEESGKVMVARKGRMIPIEDNLQLTRMLHEQLGDTEETPDERRRERMRLIAAGMASTLFVISIWFSFTRGLSTLITLDAPVEFMNPAPGVEIYDLSAKKVTLSLSGSSTLIKSIDPERLRVRINLQGVPLGHNTFHVSRDNIALPPGVLLKRVSPATVEATLDVPVKKRLPIQVDWSGRLPPGMQLVQARVTPATAIVIGRRQDVAGISTIYTQKVPLDHLRASGSVKAKLASPANSPDISLEPRREVVIHYKLVPRGGEADKPDRAAPAGKNAPSPDGGKM